MLKALLIQARDPDDPMMPHEYDCFSRMTGIPRENLTTVNAVVGDRLNVDSADLILIGGSGKYSATANFPWMEPVRDAIFQIQERGTPLFGSCWGFHIIAKTLGTPVVTNERRKELGTLQISLTEDGKKDEIFSALPPVFQAQLGHKDNVPQTPPGAVRLAYSDLHPLQAFRIQDCPIYATQFHPELTAEDMRIRVQNYMDLGYVSEEEKAGFQEILEKFQDSPESNSILKRFIQTFCR